MYTQLNSIPDVSKALDSMERGIVSLKYQPIDSEGPLTVAMETLDRNKVGYYPAEIIKPKKSVKTSHFIKLRLNTELKVLGDTINPVLLLSNNHEGMGAFKLMIGLYRFICSNGLVVGQDLFSQRIIHVQGPKASKFLSEVEGIVEKSLDYIVNGLERDIELATSTKLSFDKGVQIINQLGLSTRLTDQCLTRWQYPTRVEDSGNTLWHLWNIVNECIRKSSRSEYAITNKNKSLLASIISAA